MNLFDLYAKITLDDSEYNAGLDNAAQSASSFGDRLKNGLKTAATVGAAAIGAAAAGVAALTKASIDNYAEYEQLTGGIETLFKGSSDAVMGYAENAYKTAGMSANEYMETVTSFSASLIASLGGDTEAAAEYADQAITDMSDNANKMGSDISAIQNAYQGFAKQNYTMLDNLKLGYGGTKEEMQRLLDDAQKISGIEYDISSFADITEAIHVVQTEMGITGTTAAEASETIAGSVASMKSAWQNLTTGLADENADIDVLLDNFLDSVETVADNVLPVVERVVSNIFDTLGERGPEMVERGAELLGKVGAGAIEAIPEIIKSIPLIIEAFVRGFAESDVDIIEIGKDIVRGLWEGISSLAGWIGDKVTGFFNGLFSKVEENEEIHSPSRKWGRIGKFDAQGFGLGFVDEFESVKNQIGDEMDFDTKSVDFASSGLGKSSAGIINGVASGIGNNNGGFGGVFHISLVTEDGATLGNWLINPLLEVARANGTPIQNNVLGGG